MRCRLSSEGPREIKEREREAEYGTPFISQLGNSEWGESYLRLKKPGFVLGREEQFIATL